MFIFRGHFDFGKKPEAPQHQTHQQGSCFFYPAFLLMAVDSSSTLYYTL